MSAQNCSMEEDEKEGMRDEKRSDEARGELYPWIMIMMILGALSVLNCI